MNIDRLFLLSAYGVIGSGFAALAITGGMDSASMILYSVAFLASWFVKSHHLTPRRLKWATWIFRAYLLFYFVDLFFLSADFLLATVHLVLFTSAVKLFAVKSDRDIVFLFLISFAELVTASTMTIGLSYVAMLALFLISSVATLILLEIRRSLAAQQPSPTGLFLDRRTGLSVEATRRFQVPAFLATVLALTLLILGISIPVFFILPRLQNAFVARHSDDAQILSGFADHVFLGELGSIKKNNTVVMRVKIDAPPEVLPPTLRWRGIALDKYDGKGWAQTIRERRLLERVPGRSYIEISDEPHRGRLVAQTVYLQPLSTDILFALNRPAALVQEPLMGRRAYFVDRMGSLSRALTYNDRFRYIIWSDIYAPDPASLRQAPVPLPTAAPAVRRYFDLPPLDPRIRALADTLTRGQENSYDKARRIEDYLKTQYAYSLDLNPNAGDDPLAAFLFESKRGHCEYFATAMAVMLRCVGIPSRIVNGFLAGEFNELGSDYIVRQSDAHTWVEAFFPGESWVEFDPTPPDPVGDARPWFSWMGKVFDAAELYWEEHFIRYNVLRQLQLFTEARTSLRRAAAKAIQWALSIKSAAEEQLVALRGTAIPESYLRIGTAGLAVCGLGLLAWLFRRRLRRMAWNWWGRSESYQRVMVIESYGAMLEYLRRQGHKRSPSQTGLEFAAALTGMGIQPAVKEMTEIYYRARFRGDRVTEEILTRSRALLRSIRDTGASSRSRH